MTRRLMGLQEQKTFMRKAGRLFAAWEFVGNLESTAEGRQFIKAAVYCGVHPDLMEILEYPGDTKITLLVSPEAPDVRELFEEWKKGLDS